ncbi:MAG: DUF2299 family protein [Thermoplasmata archaeon]
MKEQITEWLDDDDREYEIIDHKQLSWLIQLKHGDRIVLLGNPEDYPKRLEVVYKLTVSKEHKQILTQLNSNQRAHFEKNLVMILSEGHNIYNIKRDGENIPDSVIVKMHMYDEDLNRTDFFNTVQNIVNIGMRVTIHFQSLGGAPVKEKEVSTTKPGPSLYR